MTDVHRRPRCHGQLLQPQAQHCASRLFADLESVHHTTNRLVSIRRGRGELYDFPVVLPRQVQHEREFQLDLVKAHHLIVGDTEIRRNHPSTTAHWSSRIRRR